MDFNNLNNKQLALVLATELVKTEIDNDYDLPSVRQAVKETAGALYNFLEYDDCECY